MFKNIHKLNSKQLKRIQDEIDGMIIEAEDTRLINEFKRKANDKLYTYHAIGYSNCAIDVIVVIKNYKLIYEICEEITKERDVKNGS
jgi:hypothetical protein